MNFVAKIRNVIIAVGIVNGTIASFLNDIAILVSFFRVVVVTTVVASVVTTRSTVKPHFKLVSTIFCNFFALGEEHLLCVVICIESVFFIFKTPPLAAKVPRRDVETILQTKFLGSFCKVARNVRVFTKLVTSILYAVFSCCGRPKAETIVVLNNCNTALHATSFNSFEPLFGIGCLCGSKLAFSFSTATPFLVGISVHTIVEEGIKFSLVPFQLACWRNRENRTRFVFRHIGSCSVQREFGCLCFNSSGNTRC